MVECLLVFGCWDGRRLIFFVCPRMFDCDWLVVDCRLSVVRCRLNDVLVIWCYLVGELVVG